MPKLFLTLTDEADHISCVDKIPELFVAKTHKEVFAGLVKIWCAPALSEVKLQEAGHLFALRTGGKELFRDVQSAVHQLQQKFHKDGTGYIALGGSPKLVKWLLKKRGFTVVTVNVSSVPAEGNPTDAFTIYLTRKLEKMGAMAKFVVLDYADEGKSLVKIKADVQALRPDTEVVAVAVGKSPTFLKGAIARSEKIDFVLTGIPTLERDLQEQRLKFHVLGRNKVKNPYATWNPKTGATLDETPMPKKSQGTNTAYYQHQKVDYAKVIDLPLLEVSVNVDDFLDDDTSGSASSAGSAEADDW